MIYQLINLKMDRLLHRSRGVQKTDRIYQIMFGTGGYIW